LGFCWIGLDQLEGVGQPGVQELLRRDGSSCWTQLDCRRAGLGPRPGDPGRAPGDEEPRPAARHLHAVGAAKGRAPVGVQRRPHAGAARQPRRRRWIGGLQPLVPPRPARHMEPALLHLALLQIVSHILLHCHANFNLLSMRAKLCCDKLWSARNALHDLSEMNFKKD
jgi:hypothetical protein